MRALRYLSLIYAYHMYIYISRCKVFFTLAQRELTILLIKSTRSIPDRRNEFTSSLGSLLTQTSIARSLYLENSESFIRLTSIDTVGKNIGNVRAHA